MVTTTPPAATQYVLVNTRTGRADDRPPPARTARPPLAGPRRGHPFLVDPTATGRRALHRVPVDLLFLARHGLVLHALHSLPPWEAEREHGGLHSVVELPAGTLARLDTRVGDTLEMYRRGDG